MDSRDACSTLAFHFEPGGLVLRHRRDPYNTLRAALGPRRVDNPESGSRILCDLCRLLCKFFGCSSTPVMQPPRMKTGETPILLRRSSLIAICERLFYPVSRFASRPLIIIWIGRRKKGGNQEVRPLRIPSTAHLAR